MRVRIGIDAGGTLIKIVYEENGLHFKRIEYNEAEQALNWLKTLAPSADYVLTGGKAAILKEAFFPEAAIIPEFTATCEGALHLIKEAGHPHKRLLLVNIGTGTSWYKIEDGKHERILGSGVGGGTFMGLGRIFTGKADHQRLAGLAAEGNREKADLLVSDIYGDRSWLPSTSSRNKRVKDVEAPIDGKLTAGNFANITGEPSEEDLMAAAANMIAETTVLLTKGAADIHHSEKIYYIGSSLQGNEILKKGLLTYSRMTGLDAAILPNGEYSGALGAYLSS
ncbi:type II pantothenate kinase [Bacillus infantis]|uniref:Type II pantothenate kinase n=1 Tax=Bacillus infantis TaxID=324767 RepID=A0A5D4SQ73_9BACI|nr:type II pantothenate kinase [Bacillus infantis]